MLKWVCYLRTMGRTLSFCAVILAAGESSRMGSDKALLQWPADADGAAPRSTFLSAAIRRFVPYAEMVFVVAGKNESELAPLTYAEGASLVVNPDPSRGQFSSLQTGLQEVLNRGRDAAMITLVDRPPVSAVTLEKLRTAFEAASSRGKWAGTQSMITPKPASCSVLTRNWKSSGVPYRLVGAKKPVTW